MASLKGSRRTRTARSALLKWYGAKARSLPWRGTKDSYAIWISEVMLQQTQIATVIPYYDRFLRAFPTVDQLARASFDRVATLWSGLGYYRRARHLHLAARQIMEDFGGTFPSSYEQARTLPGVGHYTACAVLSIAYGKPLPVLDGNVARVVARLNALSGNLQQAEFRDKVERRLGELFSVRTPGDSNQALMELGQTVCLPRGPRCTECPLKRVCSAFRTRNPELFPAPRPRRASERRHLAVAIILRNGKVVLTRGIEEGLLGDLWNFPSAFGATTQEALERLAAKLAAQTGSSPRPGRKLGVTRHTITYRSIRVELYAFSGAPHGGLFRWFSLPQIEHAAVSQLARKIVYAMK